MAVFYIALLAINLATVLPGALSENVISDSDICRLFTDNTVLLKPGYCDRGITCMSAKSSDLPDAPCSGDKPFFDPSTKKCKADAISVCKQDPCKKTSPEFVNNPYTCDGWVACNGASMAYSGACSASQYFDEETQMCNWSSELTCTASYNPCDIAPSSTQVKDEANCTQYTTCPSALSLAKTHSCGAGLFYDSISGKCIDSAWQVCTTIPMPADICGTTKLPIRNRFVSDQATCRGYFYCKDAGSAGPDKEPHWGQCPETTFFDANLEMCLERVNVKCSKDRCDGRTSGSELSETKGCQHYLECKDNVTIGVEKKCDANEYFDAYNRQCASSRTSYIVCS